MMKRPVCLFVILSLLLLGLTKSQLFAQYSHPYFPLNAGWHAVCYPEDKARYGDSIVMNDVILPHNFDDYYGSRQLIHGNLHGTAVYDLTFSIFNMRYMSDYTYRLRLEGAGSYVTVIVNGDTLCSHRPAGRIVTTLNIRKHLKIANNHIRIICEHPSRITDLPWVCGGCSSEWGFSEGSQPLGLFRPVSLEKVSSLHIQPFGVHAWSNAACDTLFVETEIENLNENLSRRFRLETSLGEENDLANQTVKFNLKRGKSCIIRQAIPIKGEVIHWSPEKPFLYQIKSVLYCLDLDKGLILPCDRLHTDFGFRNIEWGRQFKMDGKPVFLNGVCEYEHAFGHSHALTDTEIDHRCSLVKKLGYNAFRDAHQPHNLRYQYDWNHLGIVNWAQFSAHIWYDTPAFRENFKMLLRQWIKERRNDPSIILWGLQNESTLPKDFAEECTAIIKEMDPTCSRSDFAAHLAGKPENGRLVTTCNGGTGTDWNVIQNWSGTYGGKLENYGTELKRDNQLLNGEYGCWRTVGLHDTLTIFNSKAPHSEEKFSMLLQSKMDQAWAERDSICGQYLWLMYSHDNPGRYQPDEAIRLIDKVGPFNYKGLYTIWGQPTDFARHLLGEKEEKAIESDLAHHLLRGIPDMKYLYRYNCGGDSLTDSWGHLWMGDDTRVSSSWAQRPAFAHDSLCPVLASQGVTDGPVSVVYTDQDPVLLPEADQAMARTFRWGRQDLKFRFPVARDLQYNIEVFSLEPWETYATSHVYDIAVNGVTFCKDVDVVRISGGKNHLVRHTLHVSGLDKDYLEISWPYIESGQAIVCGIAISTMPVMAEGVTQPTLPTEPGYPYSAGLTWAALDTMRLAVTPKGYFSNYDANLNQQIVAKAEPKEDGSVRFDFATGLAHEYILRFRYKNVTGQGVGSRWELRSQVDDRIIAQGTLAFPVTPAKWKPVSTTTGSMINAGKYYLTVRTDQPIEFENLTIE